MNMKHAYICDGIRTPIGRYGGGLSSIRADDLAALPIQALMLRNPTVDWEAVDDVIFGSANQAGEDSRNVARMALLLAGLPQTVPGSTVNRLCGSGLDAVGSAARAIRVGEADLIIAGGVQSMTRAPYVMSKGATAFARNPELFDSTNGWRFINQKFRHMFGTDSMSETAENVALQFSVSRERQDAFALLSQKRAALAIDRGIFAEEIIPVTILSNKKDPTIFSRDEHPRQTSLELLSKLRPIIRADGTVTAGNASGINDAAAALLIASEVAIGRYNLRPMARVVAMSVSGVEPRIMGIGPVSATQKVMAISGLYLKDMDVIELNEAFAAQAIAVLQSLGLPDDAPHVNPNGGAIALGHPLGMSGARLALTAARELERRSGRYALCTMCIGVGQGIALILERDSNCLVHT
jgi:3-oxoadipyl-CoA thiolase